MRYRCENCGSEFKLGNGKPYKRLCFYCVVSSEKIKPISDTGRTLTITLDCEEEHCGNCRSIKYQESDIHEHCGIFGGSLIADGENGLLRLPKCKAACGDIKSCHPTAENKARSKE